MNLDEPYAETVVTGEKIHLFYILGDFLIYFDQEQLNYINITSF